MNTHDRNAFLAKAQFCTAIDKGQATCVVCARRVDAYVHFDGRSECMTCVHAYTTSPCYVRSMAMRRASQSVGDPPSGPPRTWARAVLDALTFGLSAARRRPDPNMKTLMLPASYYYNLYRPS
jgi:hypothetical protein